MRSEARWLRFVPRHVPGAFPYLPGQSGYNKRLRAAVPLLQLDLELHGGRTFEGVTARIAQRLLALTAAIWHNRATGQPTTRSLVAYNH